MVKFTRKRLHEESARIDASDGKEKKEEERKNKSYPSTERCHLQR